VPDRPLPDSAALGSAGGAAPAPALPDGAALVPAARPAPAHAPETIEDEILAEMAAEIDEGEEVLPADAEGDDDGEEAATSVDALGLPMPVLPVDEAIAILREGELELVGRLWASTNNAMLCLARRGGL
jgi:hypothetical protein